MYNLTKSLKQERSPICYSNIFNSLRICNASPLPLVSCRGFLQDKRKRQVISGGDCLDKFRRLIVGMICYMILNIHNVACSSPVLRSLLNSEPEIGIAA